MDTFVDWLTDPDNHMRLNNPRSIPGKKQGDLYQEIADQVNNIHDTDWTLETVKSKIQYTKKKYGEATTILEASQGNTDEGILCEKIHAICPDYERFHAAYSSALSKNPPEQSIESLEDEAEDTDDSDDDNGIADNISEDMVEVHRPTVDDVRSNTGELERKRRRRNNRRTPYLSIDTIPRFSTAAMIESTITAAVAESSLRYIKEARQDLRQREKESYQRMAENERRHQEMLDRRMQEFLEEKAKFKAKQEEFEKIRDRLITENAAMKRELEIRLAPIPLQV
ncbi:hypothetical protein BGX21_000751 [Mortierella sp. AD011]|nr:hypothetical protein BGX21_000751 [Mortierella sp. AD011]